MGQVKRREGLESGLFGLDFRDDGGPCVAVLVCRDDATDHNWDDLYGFVGETARRDIEDLRDLLSAYLEGEK